MSHLFFSGEVLSRACSEALARCTGIAHCQGQRTLRGNNRDTCVWAAAVLAFRTRGQQCRRVCCCVVEALGMGYFLHASCGPIRPSRNPPCTQLLRRSAMLSGSVPVARNGPAEFLVCRHWGQHCRQICCCVEALGMGYFFILLTDSPIPQSSMHAVIAPQCNAERLRASCTEQST